MGSKTSATTRTTIASRALQATASRSSSSAVPVSMRPDAGVSAMISGVQTRNAKTAASSVRTTPRRTPSSRRMTTANSRTVMTTVGTNNTLATTVRTRPPPGNRDYPAPGREDARAAAL